MPGESSSFQPLRCDRYQRRIFVGEPPERRKLCVVIEPPPPSARRDVERPAQCASTQRVRVGTTGARSLARLAVNVRVGPGGLDHERLRRRGGEYGCHPCSNGLCSQPTTTRSNEPVAGGAHEQRSSVRERHRGPGRALKSDLLPMTIGVDLTLPHLQERHLIAKRRRREGRRAWRTRRDGRPRVRVAGSSRGAFRRAGRFRALPRRGGRVPRPTAGQRAR